MLQFELHGLPNQLWNIKYDSEGQAIFYSAFHPDCVLDVRSNGDLYIDKHEPGKASQLWMYEDHLLYNLSLERVVDVPSSCKTVCQLKTFEPHGGDNQLFDIEETNTTTKHCGKKHTEMPYTLLVVRFDEYKDLDLATVAQVKADSSWKSDIEEWGIASLADGRCDGSGYGFNISNHMEEYGHKVVVKYLEFKLLVVSVDEYKDRPLATVAQVKANPEWKSQIETWGIATLADGRCDGSGYGHIVLKQSDVENEGFTHKVVVINSCCDAL